MQTLTETGKRTIPAVSIEAKELYAYLTSTEPGAIVSYEDLNTIAGRCVQTVARSSLNTARKMCIRNDQIVFEPVWSVGLKRLSNDEIPDTVTSKLSRIRRLSKRAAVTLACVDYDSLSNDLKIKHNAGLSILGALSELSKPNTALIENKIRADNKLLPVGKVFEIFKG